MYASRLVHKNGRLFANYRLIVVLLVSIASCIVYTGMRAASQNHDSNNFGLAPYTSARNSNDISGGPYQLVNQARFGYGLTPAMVPLLVAGFVLPTFVSWHQFMYSRNHIDGQRKQELFQ
jgi:hypothetical protein